jgi:cysteine-rich repeat protein
LIGAAPGGCAGEGAEAPARQEDVVGQLALRLTRVGGDQVLSVNYRIEDAYGNVADQGTIDMHQDGATASIRLDLPAGSNYLASMTATTVGGVPCAGESARFTVTAGATTQAEVALQCSASPTSGAADLQGTFNACPTVESLTVVPLAVDIGQDIALSAAAQDADGDPISYSWTATNGGSFGSADLQSTTYLCTSIGQHILTLTVADNRGCNQNHTALVTCLSACVGVCGNGFVDCHEQCDDGNTVAGDGCSPTCTLEAPH